MYWNENPLTAKTRRR